MHDIVELSQERTGFSELLYEGQIERTWLVHVAPSPFILSMVLIWLFASKEGQKTEVGS